MSGSEIPQAQTLARGLAILDLLAESDSGLRIADVAAGLAVHRSVAYRLLRTLEGRALVVRDAAGAFQLGPHVATLARGVAPDLQSAAQPVLQELADSLEMTAFLVVLDRSECVTLVTVEPRTTAASIALRPGSRHSVLVGAPGIAIQTLLAAADRVAHGIPGVESEEVPAARRAGFASSFGEVIPGVASVAAPVTALMAGTVLAAVAVLFVARDDVPAIGHRVLRAAAAVSRSGC